MNNFYLSLLIGCCCLASTQATGQTTAGFEDVGVPVDSFFNGRDAAGGFESGRLFLPNNYDPAFDSWTGWAISTKTDTLTPGFTNQYSAITGGGYAGSMTYAFSFGSAFQPLVLRLTGAARGGTVSEMYLTNSTYAYYSMLEGDSFSKRFGGETGDDPDFLRLTFRKYLDGTLSADSVDFYLADYRFADNSQDYILKTWTRLDLSTLGNADSLQVIMTGTDIGLFGLNTPSYFCMDAATTLDATVAVAETTAEAPLTIFPNPSTDWVWLQGREPVELESILLYDLRGRLIRRYGAENRVDVSGIEAGTYILQIIENKRSTVLKLIKN